MPSSPFDPGFDGKVGDVVEGAAPVAPAAAPVASAAPVAPRQPVAAAPPLRKPNAPVKPRVVEEEIPAASPVPVDFDASDIKQLLKYMMADQAEKIEEKRALREKNEHLRKQRELNAKDQDNKTLIKQARCKHLKGYNRSGSKGVRSQNKDYAVYRFQFINFMEYIRCRICGMKWFIEDTKDYLVRESKSGKKHKISNHTHMGWVEAVEMVEASTDTPASSERIHNINPNANNLDKYGHITSTRFVDSETGESVEGVQI